MSEHYYTEKPASGIREKEFTETIRNKTLSFVSVSGVFAFGSRIDKVSRLLLENFIPSGKSCLDIGCGYGAIGLFCKALHPQIVLTMTDINERAVAYAVKNAERNKLYAKVLKSDLYDELNDCLFWDIVTNPPISAGKSVVTRLIQEAKSHLHPGGALWLTAFHNKGGSTYKKIMNESFGNVEDVTKKGGMRVYKSILHSSI
ncbi:MAG: class I SAM-dependent methyltransferase [Clostridiaceae bacterium]|jgi:16S rRNA (guanine1207-N2)-methyltransferase|nr:class I SAM-dependent methyltransferase [Clostridiaceae bacterium]